MFGKENRWSDQSDEGQLIFDSEAKTSEPKQPLSVQQHELFGYSCLFSNNKNPYQGINHCLQAINQGSSKAHFHLGSFYMSHTKNQNIQKAYKHLILGAYKGNKESFDAITEILIKAAEKKPVPETLPKNSVFSSNEGVFLFKIRQLNEIYNKMLENNEISKSNNMIRNVFDIKDPVQNNNILKTLYDVIELKYPKGEAGGYREKHLKGLQDLIEQSDQQEKQLRTKALPEKLSAFSR